MGTDRRLSSSGEELHTDARIPFEDASAWRGPGEREWVTEKRHGWFSFARRRDGAFGGQARGMMAFPPIDPAVSDHGRWGRDISCPDGRNRGFVECSILWHDVLQYGTFSVA